MGSHLKSNLFQYLFGVAASLTAMSAGFWVCWPSSSIPLLTDGSQTIIMTESQISTMVALVNLGNIVSAVPIGYLMDAIGRRPTLILANTCSIIASCLVLFVTEVWMINTARILVGLSQGIMFTVLPIYLTEVASTEIRGGLSTMRIGMLVLGILYECIIGKRFGYFYLNLANAIIPVLFFVFIFFFPESPYYYLMKGNESAARQSLSKYRQIDEKSQDLEAELSEIASKVEDDMKNRGRFVDLWTYPTNKRALIIISVLGFFERGTGVTSVTAYSTTTMPTTGGGFSPNDYMILYAVTGMIGNIVAAVLVDRWGRKPLLMTSILCTAFATGIVSVFYYLDRYTSVDTSWIQWIPYAFLLSFSFCYSLGIGFLPSTFVGELFPANVKSYAGAIESMIPATVSLVIDKIFNSVTDSYGAHVMFGLYTISSVSCAVFTYFYVFETKGKTFREINDHLAQLVNKNADLQRSWVLVPPSPEISVKLVPTESHV